MRVRSLLLAAALVVAAVPAAAQSPAPTQTVVLPAPESLKDTLYMTAFALDRGATYASLPLTLDATLIGLVRPTHFRVSRHSDFRDATWQAYPATGAPVWQDASQTAGGECPSGMLRMLAFYQVRGLKSNGRYITTQARSDDICFPIPG